MNELKPIQKMDVFEKLVEKSISGERFTDHDAERYGNLRTEFIDAYTENDALRAEKNGVVEELILSVGQQHKDIAEINSLRAQLKVAKEALNKYIDPPIAINNSEMEVLQWAYDIASDALAKMEEK